MTISKGTALTITTGASAATIAAFTSSQAGVTYGKPGAGSILSGFLLDISGATITKAGTQADLHTVANSPMQKSVTRPVSSTRLRAVTIDNSQVVEVIPITKTATQLVGGTPYTMTFPAAIISGLASPINAEYWDGDTLVMAYPSAGSAWYLSLTNDTTQGNVVTLAPANVPTTKMPKFAYFNSTSGILVYQETVTFDLMGVPLSKSGLTLSAGTPFQIDSANPTSGQGSMGAAFVSSSRVVAGECDNLADRKLHTIDSPTTVNAATTDAASDFEMFLQCFHSGSVLCFTDDQFSASYWTEFTIAAGGGLTKTNTVSEGGITVGHGSGAMDLIDTSRIIGVFGDSGTTKTIIITTDVSPPGISDDEFTSGLLTARPVGIDMDGSFIYISALASDGTPILIKFATALNADGSIVFQPGGGTDIGVQCGRKDSDIVWVAGYFGGTDTVEKTEDAGASFTVKDDGSFDPVTSFVVGPDDDERVLIFADAGGSVASSSIYETIDDGASWETKNSGLGFVSQAVERLDINAEEIVTGNGSGVTDNIDYSPNSGEDLEDYSTGFPSQDVTSLVIG